MMVTTLVVLIAVGLSTIVAEELLLPSASRNPPPINIPIPPHASSVFASKREKQDDYEKKHEKKTEQVGPEETDDLYGLIEDTIKVGYHGSVSDQAKDDDHKSHPKTKFPFPTKIDIPLPPHYQPSYAPYSRDTEVPNIKFYGKGEKASKASAKVDSGKKDRRPSDENIDPPVIPDCFMHGVDMCDGGERPGDAEQAPVASPRHNPVRSPAYEGTKGKSDKYAYDEVKPKENKLQQPTDEPTVQPTPPWNQERPPPDISLPTLLNPIPTRPVELRPVIRSGTDAPTFVPTLLLIASQTNVSDPAAPNAIRPHPRASRMPQPRTPMPQPRTPIQPVSVSSTGMPQHSAPSSEGPAQGSILGSLLPVETGVPIRPIDAIPTVTPDDQTKLPTLAPAVQIFGTGLRAIQSDPVYLRMKGDFRPEEEEDAFFRNLEQLLGPYSRANVGSHLEEIQLSVDFITEDPSTSTVTKRQALQTIWTEVVVVYLISGDSYLSRSLATEYLQRFFVADNKKRLISQLQNDGIAIVSLDTVEELPESLSDDDIVQANDDGDTTDTALPESTHDLATEKSRKSRSSAIVAAVLSVCIVLCALGAIIVANRKRRRERIALGVLDAQLNAPTDLRFRDVDDDDKTPPKGKNYRRLTAMSCNSTISSLPSPIGKHEATGKMAQKRVSEEEDRAALTDEADGDQSYCAMHNEYETFQDTPQSPVWSIGHCSMSTPYSTEDDYVEARRRWHQSNDTDYIGLPDHHSVGGYEHSKYETNPPSDDESMKAASIA